MGGISGPEPRSVSFSVFILGLIATAFVVSAITGTLTWLVMTLQPSAQASGRMVEGNSSGTNKAARNTGQKSEDAIRSQDLGRPAAKGFSNGSKEPSPENLAKQTFKKLSQLIVEEAAQFDNKLSMNEMVNAKTEKFKGPIILLDNRVHPDREQFVFTSESYTSPQHPGATKEALFGLRGTAVVPSEDGLGGIVLAECKIGAGMLWYPDRKCWVAQGPTVAYAAVSKTGSGLQTKFEKIQKEFTGNQIRDYLILKLKSIDESVRFE